MKAETRQKLFDYFSQEHGISLMDSDFNELENAFKDADGWMPYPKNIPSDYIFQIIQGKDNEVNFGYHANGRWYSVAKELIEFDVIYFRELPAPYQPKQEG